MHIEILEDRRHLSVVGGSVSGTVFLDANINGRRDTGENALGAVKVYADLNNNSQYDSGEPWVSTRTDGSYTLANLPAKAMVIRQVIPTGFKQVSPANGYGRHVTVLVGKTAAWMDFADARLPAHEIITATVGTGSNTSHVILDFGSASFEFNVKYTATITGLQALKLLGSAGVTLSVKHFSYGDLVVGFAYGKYKWVGDGAAGNNYWGYYTAPDLKHWTYSNQGAAVRKLSNGSYDGWVWVPSHAGAPRVPMST